MPARGDSRKGKKGAAEPEVVPDEELVVPAPVVEVLSPFERLAEVWALAPVARRALVGELLELADGPDHSMEAMLLDQAYGHLDFAHDAQMNGSQTRIFFETLSTVKQNCLEEISVAENFAWFKNSIMANSTLKTTMEAVIAAEEAAAAASRPATVASTEEDKDDGKKKPDKKDKGKKDKKAEEPPPEEEVVVPEPKPRENQLFTPEMIKAMMEYMANGVFAHYNLYRSVFNDKLFQPRKRVVQKPLAVDTVVPDACALRDAVDLDEIRAQQALEEEQRQEGLRAEEEARLEASLARLVQKRLGEAREQMSATLNAHQQELTERLEALSA